MVILSYCRLHNYIKTYNTADSDKTKKRIFYELPKCNWLEEKIKDIEQSKRTEEMRRYNFNQSHFHVENLMLMLI